MPRRHRDQQHPADASYRHACLWNGVCYDLDYGQPSYTHCYEALPNTVRVTLSGQPKVSGDYVATKYNVRVGDGRQFELSAFQSRSCFMTDRNSTVAVQGCRFRAIWFGSRCTRWSTFRP